MLAHISLNVSDCQKAKEFYKKALAPLGYTEGKDFPQWQVAGIMGPSGGDLWVHGKGSAPEVTHVAFAADSKEKVQQFYDEALAAGGQDNGAPGYRPEYAPQYYAAFIKDQDGHNIEVLFWDESVQS